MEQPIVSNAATSVAFRPILSPKCPNKAAPKGLAMKASANVANDSNVAVVGLELGKKSLGNTNTAAVA